MNKIEGIAKEILQQQRILSYKGFDPFDALNSKVFRGLGLNRSPSLRLVWSQVHKRLPINVRPLLLVPRKRNPKGIALFILGLINDFRNTQNSQLILEIIELSDWLLGQRCNREKWSGSCWGYHFPWQAKAFYVPVGKPNVITTVYCSRALFEASKLAVPQAKVYAAAALDSANFIEKHLLSLEGSKGPFVAYIPGEKTFVHNASLWGAAWLLFSGKQLGIGQRVITAKAVVDRSVGGQGDSGEWVYGAMAHHQFIDGFHTGYNLEAIKFVSDILVTSEYDQCLSQGLEFYRKNIIGPNGQPYYYHNNHYPYDVHSSAQAVLTLLKVGGSAEDIALAKKVIEWTIDNMYMPKQKRFMYQITSLYKNKVDYSRWTQAWAFLMLTEWIQSQKVGRI